LSNDRYNKCNGAYSSGGAEQAMAMLNMNLDLNITDFVTVGYEAVIDAVNGLKGVWIDVDSEELKHINNYQKSILRDTDIDEELVMVKDTGYQLLNGLQAAAYCRIRYTAGDDFKRAERQREVIQAMADQAKTASLSSLTDTFFKVMNNVYTSIDSKDLQGMLSQVANYSIVEEDGFPRRDMLTTGTIGAAGSCVVATDLQSNVEWLHEFLFGIEDYEVSSTVKECSAQIKADTSPYLNRNK
jgi:LCP family protein required for cell wall assembly